MSEQDDRIDSEIQRNPDMALSIVRAMRAEIESAEQTINRMRSKLAFSERLVTGLVREHDDRAAEVDALRGEVHRLKEIQCILIQAIPQKDQEYLIALVRKVQRGRNEDPS